MSNQNCWRAENHLSCLIVLPPTDSFPQGVRLIPGLNSVPTKYFDELDAKEKPVYKVVKKPMNGVLVSNYELVDTRYPGREQLAKLTDVSVHRVTAEGRSYGPQLTVHREELAGRPDGPPPPPQLPAKPAAAKLLVDSMSDVKARALADQLTRRSQAAGPAPVGFAVSKSPLNTDELWACERCGTVHEGVNPPEDCTYCGYDFFEPLTDLLKAGWPGNAVVEA